VFAVAGASGRKGVSETEPHEGLDRLRSERGGGGGGSLRQAGSVPLGAEQDRADPALRRPGLSGAWRCCNEMRVHQMQHQRRRGPRRHSLQQTAPSVGSGSAGEMQGRRGGRGRGAEGLETKGKTPQSSIAARSCTQENGKTTADGGARDTVPRAVTWAMAARLAGTGTTIWPVQVCSAGSRRVAGARAIWAS